MTLRRRFLPEKKTRRILTARDDLVYYPGSLARSSAAMSCTLLSNVKDVVFPVLKAPLPPPFWQVDCPGHASLIRTIIGGAQILDMMLLVGEAKMLTYCIFVIFLLASSTSTPLSVSSPMPGGHSTRPSKLDG